MVIGVGGDKQRGFTYRTYIVTDYWLQFQEEQGLHIRSHIQLLGCWHFFVDTGYQKVKEAMQYQAATKSLSIICLNGGAVGQTGLSW